MQSPQNQIISLIHDLRTQNVSTAQQQLMQLTSQPQFMEIIYKIIKDPSQQAWVKTLASTFLNRVMCEKLDQLGYQIIFGAIRNILQSYQVSSSDKRCFQRSIVSLIDYIKQPQQIEQWKQFIFKHINDKQLFDTGLLLIACTAVAQIHPDYLCIIVHETFEKTLVNLVDSVNIDNSVFLNEMIKTWIVVFDTLKTIKDQDSSQAKNALTRFAKSENLAKIIYDVYRMNAPEQVWLCVQQQLYELNLLKYEAAELHRRIGQWSLKHLKSDAKKVPCPLPLINIINECAQKISNSIAIVGTNFKILQALQCQDFITSIFGLAIIFIKLNASTFTKENLEIWIHIACLPFLKAREDQLIIFEENPVQFNALAEDLCDKQTFGVLKTQAARLAQTIGDVNRQVIQSNIKFAIQCLKMKLGFVPMLQNSQIRIIQVETSFQLLSIYSYNLEKFPQLLNALKIILCDKRVQQLPPFQMSRVLLFLAYNFGDIFLNPSDGSMWIQFALAYKAHPTTRFMALDFISNIADEYFTEGFFTKLTSLISSDNKQTGQIWSIILKMLEHHKDKITEQNGMYLVDMIFARIDDEINQLKSKKKQSAIDVINALHVLRSLVQQNQFISSKPNLKKHIFKVTSMYKQAVDLNIEDQIIKIITQYTKDNIIPEEIHNILPIIIKQFQKEEYHLKTYLVLFNEVVVKSPKFAPVKPIMKVLMSGLMFHLFDMSDKAKKIKMKVAIANILTLLQNMLSVHGFQIAESQTDALNQIGAMCIRLFPQKQDDKIFSKALLAKALNLMLLCHLYSDSPHSIEYVLKYAQYNIFQNYDAYVLIKLLSKAVFAEQQIDIILTYLNIMIDVAHQQGSERNKKLKHSKTSKGKTIIKRGEQMDKILSKLTNPLANIQIKQSGQVYPLKAEFQACLGQMKSNNIDTYKLLVHNMSEEKKSKLTFLINQIAEVDGKTRVIRKVLGVKPKGKQIENDKEKDMEDDKSDNQNNESDFKRARVFKKKQKGKRKNRMEEIYNQ